MTPKQLDFDLLFELPRVNSPQITAAIDTLATQGEKEARGAVFTRLEVVDFILNLVGYTEDRPLHKMRVLEPSFGCGDFLLRIIGRLLSSWHASKTNLSVVECLSDAIRAVELHAESFDTTRTLVVERLGRNGVPPSAASTLADRWLIQGDFLLAPIDGLFDLVVGNPPYVRQELIPSALLTEYRRLYQTMYDRADLYVPFIERSLRLLKEGGSSGFICADRWTKNRYGGPLRKLVAEEFHLKIFVDMVNTPAFNSDVIAYPAITVISRNTAGPTRLACRPRIDQETLDDLAAALRAEALPKHAGTVREISHVPNGSEPWLLESFDQMALIRRLEREFPTLEEAGCKVGIGVATGADRAFIGPFDALDVEPDRKLPLVTTRDILSGEVLWRGLGVINPFTDDGQLVNLSDHPLLNDYLESRKELILRRHCAQKTPSNWYRTIDRISPPLASKPKLLIPDIKGQANVVFEDGKLYPHHNLYYITSDTWNLRALQAVLLSSVARLFVTTYSTQMRGGYFRFQAQYLRRMRIPRWHDLPGALQQQLVEAGTRRDFSACNRASFTLYGLSCGEQTTLGGDGD